MPVLPVASELDSRFSCTAALGTCLGLCSVLSDSLQGGKRLPEH